MKRLVGLLCIFALLGILVSAMAETPEPVICTLEGVFESGTVDVGISNDAAIEGFINQAFGIGTPSKRANKAPQVTQGSKLEGIDAKAYTYLAAFIKDVADGKRSSTVFTIPISELLDEDTFSWVIDDGNLVISFKDGRTIDGTATDAFYSSISFNLSLIIQALLVDCPYEMYWYDKTQGTGVSYPGISYSSSAIYLPSNAVETVTMRVAKEYSVSRTIATSDYDTSFAQSILTAANNAKGIITANRGKSDWDKLKAYKSAICNRVDYNYNAAGDSTTPYGNPWQLIWVFDDDPTTKVVCEGYSKAFKYLCDQSKFTTSISASIVTGNMDGGTGSGRHMWNIVKMGNGKRYLVDVTNCDNESDGSSQSIGYPDALFMIGYSDTSVQNGKTWYVYQANSTSIYYLYDDELTNLYSAEELEIDNEDFDPADYPASINQGFCGENLSWEIANGILTISGEGYMDDFTSGESPWYSRTDITSVVVNGALSIGSYAFENCTNLASISLTPPIYDVCEGAFSGCTGLLNIYFDGTAPEWSDISIHSGNDKLTAAELHCNEPSAMCGDNLTWTYDGNGTLTITGTGEMYSYSSSSSEPWAMWQSDIQTLIIEEGVTSIGSAAFCNCTALTNVSMPDSLLTIGNSCFSICASLSQITIPKNVSSIGIDVFSGCSGLAAISVASDNLNFSAVNGVLFNKNQTRLLCYPAGKSDTSYTIPASVTQLADDAIFECTSLTSIVLSENMDSVSNGAFSWCEGLESIYIPTSILSIGNYAFMGCTALTDVYYTGSETEWNNITIGIENESLINATKHYDYTPSIASGSCGANGDNVTWTLDENGLLTISGTGAMQNYTSSAQTPWAEYPFSSVVIEQGVTTIGDNAFSFHLRTITATLPTGLLSIGKRAFAEVNIQSIVIPDTVTSMGEQAFMYSGLESVVLPGSLKTIPAFAFGSTHITQLNLPEGLETVLPSAFDDMSVESVVIPSTLKWFGSSLYTQSIVYRGTIQQAQKLNASSTLCNKIWTCSDGTFTKGLTGTCGSNLTWEIANGTLTISGTGAMCDYIAIDEPIISYETIPWPAGDYNVIVSEGVTSIGNYAFYMLYIPELTLPSTLKHIGDWAFMCTLDGQDVALPEGIETIGDHVFGYSDVGELYIPSSVTSIGVDLVPGNAPHIACVENSYAYTYAITNEYEIKRLIPAASSITWSYDNGVLTISGTGPMDCYIAPEFGGQPSPWYDYRTSIQSVVIGDGVTSIGDYAFYNYPALASVTLAGSVESIEGSAFRNCPSLASVTLPAGLKNIGPIAFAESGLTSIAVSGTPKTWYFFYAENNGDYLYCIDLPSGVTEVDGGAFYGNPLPHENPDFVTPSSLKTIEEEAFSGTKARFVWLSDSVETIGSSAFAGCSSLKYVYVPNDCGSIGTGAFPVNTVIIGYYGTVAEDFANQPGYTFVGLQNPFGGDG